MFSTTKSLDWKIIDTVAAWYAGETRGIEDPESAQLMDSLVEHFASTAMGEASVLGARSTEQLRAAVRQLVSDQLRAELAKLDVTVAGTSDTRFTGPACEKLLDDYAAQLNKDGEMTRFSRWVRPYLQ